MAPDMLLGLDAARGADRTALQIMDVKTGKLVAMSDNVEFHCSPIWTEQELRSITETLKSFNASWTAEVKLTHKQMRQLKRQDKEFRYKKPRIPRKLKKWFATVARIHAEYMADLFYSAFSD